MRAWLLLLAVLATFQPFVQVASTEDITSSFIQAISPSIKEQQQQLIQLQNQQRQQHDLFQLEQRRDTRIIYNKNNNNNNYNTQTFVASRQLTAISPVIDITALSVTKTQPDTEARTAIATIFSYNKHSESDINTNNGNQLNKSSAKDNRAQASEPVVSDATTKAILEVQQNGNKYNKESTKQKHNEVNDKNSGAKNSLGEIAASNNKNKNKNKNTNTNNNAVQVQQLANTSDKTKSETTTTTTKSTKTLKATSAVLSVEQVPAAEEEDDEAAAAKSDITTHNKMAIPEHSKRHRHENHKQHPHKQQQHSKIAAARCAEQHTGERLATAERLAAAAASEDSAPAALHTTATHLEAAEKLAQDASLHAASASMTAADSEDERVSESESIVVTEPATYSNKEIIGDKLKPDPSTLVQIENSLLSLFNMKRPPKIDRSKIIIPEAMKQLYAQIMGHELDMESIRRPSMLSRSANTVRSFTHIESKIDDRFPHHHRFRLYFNVKSIPTDEKLRAADLQLSREAISDAVLSEQLANRTSYQVLVYDITRVGVRGKREPSYKLLDNKLVHLNSTETVSFDVQKAVDRWLATPKKNYGLLIEVRTPRTLKPAPHHHVRLRRSVDEPHDSWQHKQPVLYAYTDDGKHRMRSARDTTTSSSRSKRAGHHRRAHRRKNNDEICRRHSLYVDFADVGWSDWIVAPPGYDAFYCQGKCPFQLADHLNSTNHAVVQTLVNNLNPGKVPKACCVPTQLEGISMLYLNDQNTVVLKNYQDMTVVGCGCR